MKISAKEKAKISRYEKVQEYLKEGSKIKLEFDKCQQFKNDKGIINGARRAVDYYEGRQWVDTKTKLPFEKPQMNVIQNIIDTKASSINSKVLKIRYSINEQDASTKNVTRFAEYQTKEMEQETKNYESTMDGLIKGTYCWFFYWDEDAIGQTGDIEGALCMNVVDVADIAVSDPSERDVQKQEWIIIHKRESVKAVKAMCTTLTDEEKDTYITSTQFTPTYTKDSEHSINEMTDVYTKLFRQNGEVYFEISTNEVLIKEATSINPHTNLKAIKEKLKESNEEELMLDEVNKSMMNIDKGTYSEEEKLAKKFRANLFPVVIDSFYKRNNSIFGISLVEQIIPLQKIINQQLATMNYISLKCAYPTLVVKEGALGTSSIDTSKPNAMIIDRSPQGVDGIKQLNSGSFPTQTFELANSLIALTKDNYKANDVLESSMPSGTSGYAISQLIQLQDKPIAQWQQVLSRSMEREARILEMFYKLYYVDKKFTYKLSDAEFVQQFGKNKINTPINDIFNGQDYINTPFNVSVEVGEGAKYSELMVTSVLETLFLNGTIRNLSAEDLMMYVELVPEATFPSKTQFKELIKQKQEGELAQLQQRNQMLEQQYQELEMQSKAMQQEFTTKVNQYNEQLKTLSSYIKR